MLGSFSRASRSFSSNQCSRGVGADAVMKSVKIAEYPTILETETLRSISLLSVCELSQCGAEELFEGAFIGGAELFQRFLRRGRLIAQVDER